MASVASTVLSLTGVTGSCCAIVLPVTMKSRNYGRGGSLELAQASSSGIQEQRHIGVQDIRFDELGKKVNADYKLAQVYSSQSVHELPGKEELKSILSVNNDARWNLKSQKGVDCFGPQRGLDRNCGYLHISDGSFDYKFRAQHSQEDFIGRIFIARQAEKVDYGSNISVNGVNLSNANFEQLGDDFGTEWNLLSNNSIYKSYKKMD